MKIGERGQITIPKQLRERFDLRPGEEVEFDVVNDTLVLRKIGRKLNLAKWKGYCLLPKELFRARLSQCRRFH